MKLLAHITEVNGVKKEQDLKEHCFQAAEYASQSVGSADIHNIVYLAGLMHDLGKAKKEWVEYLKDAFSGKPVRRGSVNHTFAGVIFILEKYHSETSTIWEKLTCEIIGYAVGSHHGMFDCVDLDCKNGFLYRLQKDRKDLCYDESINNYFAQVTDETVIEEYFQRAAQEVERFFNIAKNTYTKSGGGKVFFQISMLVRLVLSAVIYGDRRDTSMFMNQPDQNEEQKLVRSKLSNCYKHLNGVNEEIPNWKSQLEYFEKKILKFDSSEELDQVRSDISKQCLKAAERPSGIYRLNVPTGGGKTLCTLRYALAHAEKYQKKRIIFIIPLLSILDQNVKVIREYVLDAEDVLEHHSNVIHGTKNKTSGVEKNITAKKCVQNSFTEGKEYETNAENVQAEEEELDRYEFLEESWNAPIIVSTLMQLLNILFSQQTSAIGRMQALCDSVIVIDEVQSLPKKITTMFNMAMNFLQQYCNASIVLSSATQPCFEDLNWSLHLMDEPDLVCLNKKQLQLFRRAEIINRIGSPGMDWEQCTDFCYSLMEQYASLLIVCNTKAEACILFERLKEYAEFEEWNIFHLSTSMCQAHRIDELNKLKDKLSILQKNLRENKSVRKLICVSTQLIEAGVDISCECVVRVLAGIDNLAQAAGRCNRSNEYGQTGKVYLINLKNENLSMLKDIHNAQICTRKVLEDGIDEDGNLIDEPSARKFYQYLFKETKSEIRYPCQIKGTNEIIYLTDLLSNGNNQKQGEEKYILHQPFKTVGENFKIFDQNTIDVLVPYKKGKQLINQLEVMQRERFDIGKFKNIVQRAQSYAVSIYEWQRQKLDQAGLLYYILDGRVLVLDEKAYNSSIGIMVIEEQEVENYIF